jgi:hypothetical protein
VYDPEAIERFANLRAVLSDTIFPDKPCPLEDKLQFYNVAFFDAYFSNFIEGTEFEVKEALEISSPAPFRLKAIQQPLFD